MVHLSEKVILQYLTTTSESAMCPNLITVRAKGRNHLPKEVKNFKIFNSLRI